jgi:hypothetical protein
VWWTIVAVALVALTVALLLTFMWPPQPKEMRFELGKASYQVLAIAVAGGLITFATTRFQHARQAADRATDRRHEESEIRATLLDRASRCAQTMYVTCQHVRRKQADYQDAEAKARLRWRRPRQRAAWEEAQGLLDQTYCEFNAEARAVETVISVRFVVPKVQTEDGVYVLWHQVYDLLTLYYFNLCGDFRIDVLRNNLPTGDRRHSGLDRARWLKLPRFPQQQDLTDMRVDIRKNFEKAMIGFAKAMATEELAVSGITDEASAPPGGA